MMKVINGPEVTAKLSAGLKDIARLTGFSEKVVTKGEAGQILKTWAGRTKVATAAHALRRARARALYSTTYKGQASATSGYLTVNSGVRGGIAGNMWFKTRNKKFQMAGVMNLDGLGHKWSYIHWKKDDWLGMVEAAQKAGDALRKMIPLAENSRGLSRQSVIQIADKLNIDLGKIPGGGISAAGIAKARAAIASNGQRYINGTGSETEEKNAGRYFVTLINSLPYHAKAGLDRTLAGVLAGRVGLYRRTFANGAFTTIKAAARSYPWIRPFLTAA